MCLCRRHHRIKQRPGWSVRLGVDGTAAWTDPVGRHLVTWPRNYLDLLTLPAAVAGPIDPLTPAPYQRPARGVATAAAATTAAATSDNPGSALPTDSAATEVSILETVFEVLGDGYRPTTTAHPPSPAQRRWCGDLVRARPDRACLTFPRRRDDDPHHHIHAGPLVAAEKFEIEPPPF